MTTKHARDMTPEEYAAAVDALEDVFPIEEQYRREDEADRLAATRPPAQPEQKRVVDMDEYEYAAAKAALDD